MLEFVQRVGALIRHAELTRPPEAVELHSWSRLDARVTALHLAREESGLRCFAGAFPNGEVHYEFVATRVLLLKLDRAPVSFAGARATNRCIPWSANAKYPSQPPS